MTTGIQGTVALSAQIVGNGLTFPRVEVPAGQPEVTKVGIEASSGHDILLTVDFQSIASEGEAIAIATQVARELLDRLAFRRSVAIGEPRVTGSQFTPLCNPPGVHTIVVSGGVLSITGCTATLTVGLSPESARAALAAAPAPGRRFYGLIRSALLSSGPVEQFMHLYNILLMLCGDKQSAVESFIKREDKTVQIDRSQDSHGKWVTETVYTRLRDELAHTRPGVDLSKTRAEMASRVGGLTALTKRAIELQP